MKITGQISRTAITGQADKYKRFAEQCRGLAKRSSGQRRRQEKAPAAVSDRGKSRFEYAADPMRLTIGCTGIVAHSAKKKPRPSGRAQACSGTAHRPYEHVAELVVIATSQSEVSAVVLSKGADQSVAMLAAHLSVLVAVCFKGQRESLSRPFVIEEQATAVVVPYLLSAFGANSVRQWRD